MLQSLFRLYFSMQGLRLSVAWINSSARSITNAYPGKSFGMLAFMFISSAALANTAEQQVSRWSDLLESIDSNTALSADFRQQTLDAEQHVIQAFDGYIAYRQPNKFIWQANAPIAQQLQSDGEFIWQYDRDLAQVIVQPYASQAENAILLAVLQAPERLKDDYHLLPVSKDVVASTHASSGRNVYVLRAKHMDVDVQAIELVFLHEPTIRLETFSFTDLLGQTTSVSLTTSTLAIDDVQFVFQVPADVDVIYE